MPEVAPGKYAVTATWDDSPHLTAEQKDELWGSIPVYQRDARSKGIPQLGSGAIYPIVEERITVDDFEIPEYWPRAYALDVGWHCTAALWGAWDRQSDTVYVYSEYKQGLAEPATHVDGINSRGGWIPGVVDPSSLGASQLDGKVLFDEYVGMGLELHTAENAVEAGIHAVYRRMVSGRLKVFVSLRGFLEEFRLYRRDEKGKVVKDNDHLMDCARYLVMSGMQHAIDELMALGEDQDPREEFPQGRSAVTGY